MKAIGIDIGIENIYGILIDAKTGVVEKSVSFSNTSSLHYRQSFQQIQEVSMISNIVDEILKCIPLEGVSAIGLTGQMHGMLYVDKKGNPASSLYTWRDGRGELPYKNTTYAKYLGSYSGYGNVTDFYNRENGLRPEKAVTYCTIADFIAMKLCGLKEPYIHDSNAASFGNYNIESMTFDYDYNPKITKGYTIIGEYKGIPVSVAIGDNQASVFSTLIDEDDVLVNVGTESMVSVISDTPAVSSEHEIRPYFDNKYLIVGTSLGGGRIYTLLKDFYKAIVQNFTEVSDDEIYSYMNSTPINFEHTLMVDSRFAGTRQHPELTGNIKNIKFDNFAPENLTSSLLDALSGELYCFYRHIETKRGGLIGAGNGIRKNPALVKYLENRFKTIMKIPVHIEEAAFGAALYALISAGVFKNAEEAQKIVKFRSNENAQSFQIKVGERIASLRKLNGITQTELAEMLSISNSAISKWETGLGYPDINFLPKLASVFNVTVDFLLGYNNT